MSYKVGDVVWFHNPKFPELHHPHIIIAQKEGITYLVCCSTKIDKTKKECAYIEKKKISDTLNTFVNVPARSSSSIEWNCAINCNAVYDFNLIDMANQEEYGLSVKFEDHINIELLNRIKVAISHSVRINSIIRNICGCPITN